MKTITSAAAVLFILCTTGCVTNSEYDRYGFPKESHVGRHYEYGNRLPPMDPNRTIVAVDCGTLAVQTTGNLYCTY